MTKNNVWIKTNLFTIFTINKTLFKTLFQQFSKHMIQLFASLSFKKFAFVALVWAVSRVWVNFLFAFRRIQWQYLRNCNTEAIAILYSLYWFVRRAGRSPWRHTQVCREFAENLSLPLTVGSGEVITTFLLFFEKFFQNYR